jgi:hypothetical protein
LPIADNSAELAGLFTADVVSPKKRATPAPVGESWVKDREAEQGMDAY